MKRNWGYYWLFLFPLLFPLTPVPQIQANGMTIPLDAVLIYEDTDIGQVQYPD